LIADSFLTAGFEAIESYATLMRNPRSPDTLRARLQRVKDTGV
jgi:hypothetical protein